MKLFKCFVCIGLLFVPVSGFAASGAYNNDIADARSLGNANAVSARPVSPATNWYNPAGLVRLHDSSVTVSAMGEFVDTSLDSSSGRHVSADDGLFAVPSIFYASRLPEGWAFGLGASSPYGLSTRWDDPVTRYVTVRAEYKTYQVNPNLAYAFNDYVAVAAGLDVVQANGVLSRRINQTGLNGLLSGGVPGLYPDSTFELTGTDAGVGGNLALLLTPCPEWQCGLTYRSRVDVDVTGTAKLSDLRGPAAALFGGERYTTGADISIPVPASVTAGVAWLPESDTSLELDLEWVQWSAVDRFDVGYTGETNPVRLAVLNAGNPIPKNWNDTWNLAFGIEHRLSPRYSIFGGTRYRPSPIPEGTFDPSVPSLDLIDLDGGFSIHWDRSRLDVALALVHGLRRSVHNTVGQASGASINGNYEMETIVAGVSYTWQF